MNVYSAPPLGAPCLAHRHSPALPSPPPPARPREQNILYHSAFSGLGRGSGVLRLLVITAAPPGICPIGPPQGRAAHGVGRFPPEPQKRQELYLPVILENPFFSTFAQMDTAPLCEAPAGSVRTVFRYGPRLPVSAKIAPNKTFQGPTLWGSRLMHTYGETYEPSHGCEQISFLSNTVFCQFSISSRIR